MLVEGQQFLNGVVVEGQVVGLVVEGCVDQYRVFCGGFFLGFWFLYGVDDWMNFVLGYQLSFFVGMDQVLDCVVCLVVSGGDVEFDKFGCFGYEYVYGSVFLVSFF